MPRVMALMIAACLGRVLRSRPKDGNYKDEEGEGYSVSAILGLLAPHLAGLITSETIGKMLLVKDALPKGGRLGPWSRPAGA